MFFDSHSSLRRGDCFIARGGDSLLMVMLSARLRDVLGKTVSVPAIAAGRTLRAVAALVDDAAPAPPRALGAEAGAAAGGAASTPASRLADYSATLLLAEPLHADTPVASPRGGPRGGPRATASERAASHTRRDAGQMASCEFL